MEGAEAEGLGVVRVEVVARVEGPGQVQAEAGSAAQALEQAVAGPAVALVAAARVRALLGVVGLVPV
jgi:hypothetical protein